MSKLSSSDRWSEAVSGLQAEQRSAASTLAEIKADIREMRTQMTSVAVVLAAFPAQYITTSTFGLLAERVNGLEGTRDRASGAMTVGHWLWLVVGMLLSVGALALSGRVKLW